MTEKIFPSTLGGVASVGSSNTKEAVCVHTTKIYDSCKMKECLRDIRVYLCREGQELLNEGGIADAKPRKAELLCVNMDVEQVQFKQGFLCYNISACVCGSRGYTVKLRLPELVVVTRSDLV